MFSRVLQAVKDRAAQFRARYSGVVEIGPGVFGSVLLHGSIFLFILLLILRHAEEVSQKQAPFVPVDVVQWGDETTSPPSPNRAPVPAQKAMKGPASAPKPEGYSPRGTRQPKDELEVQLKNLAQLRQPNSDLKIENGASDETASSNGADEGTVTAYSVRDYIRAQVLRRWVFDFSTLGKRSMQIALHVSLTGRGNIIKVEVADRTRYATDKLFRDVALSARNAVLLSAPFKLPDGAPKEGIDFTMNLDPRDTLR